MSKPMLWPTTGAPATNASSFSAASLAIGAPATSAAGMPCIWTPKISAARVHEGREPIDDLAVANADGADLDQVGNLGVSAGRLGVENDQLVAGLADLLDELQNGAGARLEVHGRLGLAGCGA